MITKSRLLSFTKRKGDDMAFKALSISKPLMRFLTKDVFSMQISSVMTTF